MVMPLTLVVQNTGTNALKKILNTITSTNKKEDNYHLNYWKKIITNYSMTKDRDKDAQNIEKSKIELI